MDIIVSVINSTPDAVRYAVMDTGVGHLLVVMLRLVGLLVWEDGSISLP